MRLEPVHKSLPFPFNDILLLIVTIIIIFSLFFLFFDEY